MFRTVKSGTQMIGRRNGKKAVPEIQDNTLGMNQA